MFILIFLMVVLDQLTKYLAINYFKNESIKIIDNFLYLTYVENKGAAWGIFQDATIILTVISIVVSVLLIYYLLKNRKNLDSFVAFLIAMIISGAIGNLIDRVLLGYVIDFIYSPLWNMYSFPVFNFADMYISLSIIALIFIMLFTDKLDENNKKVEKNDN